jgi:glycosyltransferase involved in cell wall biosynthesis
VVSQNELKLTKESNIRVLHVTPWFPPHLGGIAKYVSNLCTHLSDQGYEISVLTAKHLNEKTHIVSSKPRNIEYISCIYLPGWPYQTLKSVSVPVDAGAKMNSFIKKGDFDLIHAHDVHYPISWLALYFARKHGARSVLTLHGSYALNPNVLGGETRIEKWLYQHLFPRILSKADAVIGPSESLTSLAREHYKGSGTSFYTVTHGLDTGKYMNNLHKKMEYRKKHNISHDAIVLLFTGRFEKVKGILELCHAAKKIVKDSSKKVEIAIIGTGSLKDEVYSVARNTTGIHIFEWQPEEEIYQFYVASDIFMMPSRFEGLPLTLLEAMSCGLHIIYSAVGGIPDILRGYPSKTVLQGISEKHIYDAVMNLILSFDTSDKEDSLLYARGFDWSKKIHEVTAVYNRVLG